MIVSKLFKKQGCILLLSYNFPPFVPNVFIVTQFGTLVLRKRYIFMYLLNILNPSKFNLLGQDAL